MDVPTRSYNRTRTGANEQETILTPHNVGRNVLVKLFSLNFNDDPRLEAQPLYMSDIKMSDGNAHDVVYVCTMANNVWAFDANDGRPIWAKPANLGRAIKPAPAPHAGFPDATDIDLWGVNKLWGVLSTPVIDTETKRMYVVNWASPDGTEAQSSYNLHELDITSGQILRQKVIAASAGAQGKPAVKFQASRQKQRAALLLTRTGPAPGEKTVFVAFGMTHEEGDPTHGWLIAFDVATLGSVAWCTSPNGEGTGIWQAGQGPAADENGDIYLMTGNYGSEDANGNTVAPAAGDLPESLVKLHYTPPGPGGAGAKLQAVAWFTPFTDHMRNKHG